MPCQKRKIPHPASALSGHIARPDQPRLQHSMRAALWWLLPSDGEFRRASHSLQYYLARQGRRVVLQGGDVTQPKIYENRLFWIPDPAPPTPCRPDDLTSSVAASPSSVPASAVNTPPSEAHPRLPRRLQPWRRRKRQPAAAANENSFRWASSVATRLRSTANRNSPIPGNQPGIGQPMRSTPVEHSQSFTSPSLTQPPISAANQNAGISSCRDHSEIWGLYKPAQTDPRQDLTATHSRDNISGFGLSSPALQQPSTKPFSGLPSRQMTSPHREAGEAERERPGIVYPLLPRAARPDTWLMIDAALPEAAALDRRSRPPTVLEITESRLKEDSKPQGPRRRQSSKRRRNRSTGVYRPSKRSPPRSHWCD